MFFFFAMQSGIYRLLFKTRPWCESSNLWCTSVLADSPPPKKKVSLKVDRGFDPQRLLCVEFVSTPSVCLGFLLVRLHPAHIRTMRNSRPATTSVRCHAHVSVAMDTLDFVTFQLFYFCSEKHWSPSDGSVTARTVAPAGWLWALAANCGGHKLPNVSK